MLVRLGAERRDEARPGPRHPVRPDIVLRQEPEAGLGVSGDDALTTPVGEIATRLLLVVRQGQVDDVVRAAGEVLRTLFGRDDVVGRRDEALERTGLPFVVALGAERLDLRHGGDPSIRPRT